MSNQKIRFPVQDKARGQLKQTQNELKNKTRLYLRNDVTSLAQRVQQGKTSIYRLYDQLEKMKSSNLLKAYDQDYADVLHNGMNNLTVREAYACYLKYPEQYQNLTDFHNFIQKSDEQSSRLPQDHVGKHYANLLRENNRIKERIRLVERVTNIFGHKYIIQEQGADDSISASLRVSPRFFDHVSIQNVRAGLAEKLLGQVDYQIHASIALPVNNQQKKAVHVQILNDYSHHLNYEPADLDIILKG